MRCKGLSTKSKVSFGFVVGIGGADYGMAGRDEKGIDLDEMVKIGAWINEKLGRETGSKVGRAIEAKRRREEERKRKEGAKL